MQLLGMCNGQAVKLAASTWPTHATKTLTHDIMLWLAGYIGEFEYVDDHRAGKIVVELNGRCCFALLPPPVELQCCRCSTLCAWVQ